MVYAEFLGDVLFAVATYAAGAVVGRGIRQFVPAWRDLARRVRDCGE